MKKIFNKIIFIFLALCVVLGMTACASSKSTTVEADKYLSSWMSYLSPEALIGDVVIPGAHDAGTANMSVFCETQKSKVDEMLAYGVRYFDLRTSLVNGKLYFFHTFDNKKYPFSEFCDSVSRFLTDNPSEFLILDFQHFKNDSMKQTAQVIEESLSPDVSAVPKDEDISRLSMAKIRAKGYKYMVVWGSDEVVNDKDWIHQRKTTLASPYDSDINSLPSEQFVGKFDYYVSLNDKSTPLFVLQSQHTCNYAHLEFNIYDREIRLRPYANAYLDNIYNSPATLAKTNIIMRDFVTLDTVTVPKIIRLNIPKGNFSSIPEGLK